MIVVCCICLSVGMWTTCIDRPPRPGEPKKAWQLYAKIANPNATFDLETGDGAPPAMPPVVAAGQHDVPNGELGARISSKVLRGKNQSKHNFLSHKV